MIPSIEEILAGLAAGDYTVDQAQRWIDEHMRLRAMPLRAALTQARRALQQVNCLDMHISGGQAPTIGALIDNVLKD